MEKLKIGDLVKLKSGSPEMTVVKNYNNGYVKTLWFIDGKPYEYEFVEESLKKLDPIDNIYRLPD